MCLSMTYYFFSLLHSGFEFIRAVLALALAATRNRIALLVKLDSKVESHAAQNVANFSKSFLAKILGRQHFTLRSLHQIAHRLDAGVLQTIIGTHRKFELVH